MYNIFECSKYLLPQNIPVYCNYMHILLPILYYFIAVQKLGLVANTYSAATDFFFLLISVTHCFNFEPAETFVFISPKNIIKQTFNVKSKMLPKKKQPKIDLDLCRIANIAGISGEFVTNLFEVVEVKNYNLKKCGSASIGLIPCL